MRSNKLRAACTHALVAWACTAVGTSGAAAAPQAVCPNDKQLDELRSSNFLKAVGSALTGTHCSAVIKVLAQLQATKKPGGRKLHEGKPLDRAAAQAELLKARSDPDFTRKLTAVSEGVTDPTGRLVVEAALLDDEGYFAARQLLMEDILKAQEVR